MLEYFANNKAFNLGFSLVLILALNLYFVVPTLADTTNLVITSCDVNNLTDATCYSALSADGGTSFVLGKGNHIDGPFQTLSPSSVNSATLYYDSSGSLSGTWGIYVKDARDGTTICSVDPAPEDGSETTNSTSCSVSAAQLSSGVWLQINNDDDKGPENITIDYARLFVDYVAGGSLSVDIVDSGGNPVTSPSVSMNTATFDFDSQTVTGTFGTASEKIRVDNGTGTATWSVTLAATSGNTTVWTGTGNSYDFNDPTASAVDGGDGDSVGGQLTVDASGGTVTAQGGCTTTGISKGSSTAFSEGVTDSITILSADGTADTGCYWDLTGVSLSQTLPAEQDADTYSIDMTLTVS